MPKEETEKETQPAQLIEVDIDLDAPAGFLNLTLRQVHDWEARHRNFCRLSHRQPCNCSAWD